MWTAEEGGLRCRKSRQKVHVRNKTYRIMSRQGSKPGTGLYRQRNPKGGQAENHKSMNQEECQTEQVQSTQGLKSGDVERRESLM